MEEMFLAFLSWQFLFFCIAIGAVVFVLRSLIEFAMANWWPLKQWSAAHKGATLWTELILPVMPIVIGQMMALLITLYPYPEGFTSAGGRFLFGLVAGFSSGLIVRIYNSFLSGKVIALTEKVTTLVKPKELGDTELVKETTTSVVKATTEDDLKSVEKTVTVVEPKNETELTEKKVTTTTISTK